MTKSQKLQHLLSLAAPGRSAELAAFLTSHPDSVQLVDRYRRSALHEMALTNNPAAARTLIAAGSSCNAPDRYGKGPLHYAASSHHLAVAKELLSGGADVDMRDAHGNTPLSDAVFASRGRGELITFLLSHNADPHAKNNYGVSPYSLACTIANYEIAKFFPAHEPHGTIPPALDA